MNRLFKNKRFLFFWLGQTISGIGNWINFVGLNLYVLEIFGGGGILGMFLMARMLPSVLFGSFGGYLADRANRRNVMIACDLLRAVIVLGFLITRNIYIFFLLGMLLSALDKVFISARGSFLPEIVEPDDLLEANGIKGMTTSVITIIGPAVGAVLVSVFTYRLIFIIDSLTFVASVLCLLLIPISRQTTEKRPPSRGIFREFVDEYRTTFIFLGGHRPLLFLMMLRFIDAVGSGAYNIALPIFSRTFTSLDLPWVSLALKGGSAYGWLVGIWALGQFAGSYAARWVSRRFSITRENLFSISITLMAVGMGLTFQSWGILWSLGFIFLGGVGDGISTVVFVTMLMKDSPDKVRGKVFGTIMSLIFTAVATGMLAGGWLADYYPLSKITMGASLAIIIGVILGRFYFFYRHKSPAG